MRKLFSFCVALFATTALWAYDFESGGLYYDITSSEEPYEVQVTNGNNDYSGEITVPTSVTYESVTYSVTSIGELSFYDCTGLTSVTIPNSVTNIEAYAFYNCGLTKPVYNETLFAYMPTSYSGKYSIPDGIKQIVEGAFCGCTNLTLVTIPESVTSIGDNAFYEVPNIIYTGTATGSPWGAKNVGYLEEYLVYENATKTTLLACNSEATGTVEIPNSVTSIGSSAFSGCTGITSVIWNAKNCESNDNKSPFSDIASQISSFSFGNRVENIPDYLCQGMNKLSSITIPNNVTNLGGNVFSDCTGITSVVWNARSCSLSYNNNYDYCPFSASASQITSFTFGNEVEKIPESICYGMNKLSSIIIPNGVTNIGYSAFYGCTGLTSITIPENVTSIGGNAFGDCTGITSIVWNARSCSLDSYSYYGYPFSASASQITSFTFGDKVEEIPSYICYGMSNLSSITIPNNVTSIGANAFHGCTGITSVIWNAKNCKYNNYQMYQYDSAPFSDIASQISSFTFGNEVESLPDRLCQGMNLLSSITIPNSVTSIGEYTFSGCTGITSINIPNSVVSIGGYAFYGCTSLTKPVYNETLFAYMPTPYNGVYSIPDGIRQIIEGAFANCTGLTSITISNSVTSIGNNAFDGCYEIDSVVWNAEYCKSNDNKSPFSDIASQISSFTFGNEVEFLPNYLCKNMYLLNSITIPNSVTSIGTNAFYGCTDITKVVWNAKNCTYSGSGSPFAESADKITSFTFGNEVETIPSDLCNGFRRVRSVTLPSTLSEIGDSAFYGCNGLVDITIYATLPPVAETSSFSNYNATLHVPCDVLQDYRRDAIWGQFSDIQCICANEIETIDDVTVVAALNDAAFTWPQNVQAGSYTLVISKDGEVFCTLTFNGSGQLMGIAFAPSSNGTIPAQAAEATISGYQFTVTGLDEASNYTYNLTVKDATGNVLHTYTGAFATDGATGLDNTAIADLYSENGRIVCAGEFTIYDLLGRDVTRMNGQLNGVYVVKVGDKAQKVIVR